MMQNGIKLPTFFLIPPKKKTVGNRYESHLSDLLFEEKISLSWEGFSLMLIRESFLHASAETLKADKENQKQNESPLPTPLYYSEIPFSPLDPETIDRMNFCYSSTYSVFSQWQSVFPWYTGRVCEETKILSYPVHHPCFQGYFSCLVFRRERFEYHRLECSREKFSGKNKTASMISETRSRRTTRLSTLKQRQGSHCKSRSSLEAQAGKALSLKSGRTRTVSAS